MSTVEEVTTAVRQVAAHEARTAVVTERLDEMRDHLYQAGLHLQAAEAQVQAGGNMSGYVKFALSKEMMSDRFNGTDRMRFSDWSSGGPCRVLETTSTWETSWSGSGRYKKMWIRTRLTCSRCSGDGLDECEITRGFQGTCSLC